MSIYIDMSISKYFPTFFIQQKVTIILNYPQD